MIGEDIEDRNSAWRYGVLFDTACEPFMKWGGGKRKLAKTILRDIPAYDTYVEPFLGGGAIFFALSPSKALLYDSNERIVNIFSQVKNNPYELIKEIRKHNRENSEEYYYKVRDSFNEKRELGIKGAGMFLYVMQACFNGIYNLNSKGNLVKIYVGKEKVFIGRSRERKILTCHRVLRNASIECRDFREVDILKNALYFIDPPYIGTNLSYGVNFSIKEWEEVRMMCNKIWAAGSHFIVTHLKNEDIDNLFRDFSKQEVSHEYTIGGTKAKRVETIYRSF